MFGLKKGRSIAIDLGNCNTLLSVKDNFLSQPSVIVYDQKRGVKAVGRAAFEMYGKVSGDVKVVRPLKGGVIADLDAAGKMLDRLMDMIYPKRTILFGFDNIISGVPYATTEVERRALRVALGQFSSGNTYMLFEPLAAAVGLGLNIREPEGKLILDIGGGISEASLISLSGIVTHRALKIAGDDFDIDIKNYFERHYYLSIGTAMAEAVKIKAGSALIDLKEPPEPAEVVGKDLITGIPKSVTIDHQEISIVLDHSISKIEDLLMQVLEECPPELAGDVYMNGIYLTGGSALLRGLKERLENKVKLKITVAPNPLDTVAEGISKVLTDPKKYAAVLFK